MLIGREGAASSIAVGSPSWYAWLEDATTFAFTSAQGGFTARKERSGQTGWYWKAYRKRDGTLHRAYLGKSADLSLDRLTAIATDLAQRATGPPRESASVLGPEIATVDGELSHLTGARLPEGTLTFCFTDIEGSTQLWEQHPQTMPAALARHDAILHALITAHHGVVFKTVGDSAHAVFSTAPDALAAALACQRALHAEPWGETGPLLIRMALHTGMAVARDGDYYGAPLNRVARILAAGHGRQILLSLTTEELVRDHLPPDTTLRDLGIHHLKDLRHAEQIFQLVSADVPTDFPPLRTLASPPAPASIQPLQLLDTKLYVPPVRPQLVPRPRLLARLDTGLAGKLTLLSAPPGFGKTTLLSAWIASLSAEGRGLRTETVAASLSPQHSALSTRVAWVSLDAADSDPLRFWRYVIAALDMLQPDSGASALALLQSPQPPPIETVLTPLLNALSTLPTDAVLVLDDYHLIDAPAIHSALAFLLDHLPPQLHLVITTRADPPLPLTRLRARGQLTELRAADLRFTADETATFLTELMGLPLSADDVAALEVRTEGWIAGLQLAALAAREHAHPAQYIQAFTGDHRFIIDYLVDEVLERQPAHIKSFLLHTAILDRLCGPLCDALLLGTTENQEPRTSENDLGSQFSVLGSGSSYSQRILDQLEHANLFLTALDNARRWYRYHPLFAEVLRSRLIGGASATEIAALHQRASAWLEQHGLLDDAIRQSLAAQDVNAAIRLIERAAPDLLRRGEVATLLGWIAQLSTTRALDHPQLCLFAAWAYATFGRWDDIDALLQRAEHGDLDLRQQGDVATLRALTAFGHGKINRAMDFAHAALAISEQLNTDGQAMSLHSPLLPIVMLAQSEAICGQLYQAAETLQRALPLARQVDQRGDSPLMHGIIQYSLSEVLYQFGDLTAAERAARAALAHSEQAGNGEIAAYSYAGLARIAQAHGNAELARQCMQQAEQHIRPRAIPAEIAHVLALQARLWLAQGDLEAAQRWAAAEASTGEQLLAPREAVQMTLVRMYTALNQPDQAHDLIARLLADAEAGGQQGRVIELLMLQALALSRQRHVARAHAALERALALAEPAGYVRLFVDESAPMAALLAQVVERESPLAGYAAKLLAAFPETMNDERRTMKIEPPNHRSSLIVHPLVELLSERELEVLRLIADGHSNQAIATRLVVAVSTIKKHVNNLYGKLDVQSRTQALARARELHLL